MQGLGARFRFVVCLMAVVLSGQSSARIWRRPTLPSNPNDPYYQKFQTVPPAKVTARKFIKDFLHIRAIGKRQIADNIEDIVAIMDGSGSVGACEFGKGKKALKYLMKESDVGGYDTKYAAVTFASSANVNFKFLPYSTASEKISTIPYPSGSTNTQAGLSEAKKLFDDLSSGGRVNARKVVLLVTDGQSNIQKQMTVPNARILKNSGVKIYVIAVGNSINGINEMVKVASPQPEDHIFRVKTMSGFLEVVKLILKEVSPGKYDVDNGQFNPPC